MPDYTVRSAIRSDVRGKFKQPTGSSTLQVADRYLQRISLRASPYTFQGLGLRIARLAGIFRNALAAADNFLPPNQDCTQAELETAFKTWAAYESQLRAVLCIYIVDGQFMHLFRAPSASRHLSNPFVPACDDTLFNAPNATVWREVMKERVRDLPLRRQRTFGAIYKQIWDESDAPGITIDADLSPMSKAVIIVGLSSVIAELREARAQNQLYDRRMPVNMHLGLKRLRGMMAGSSSPPELIGLRMAWHSLYLDLLLIHAIDPVDLYTSAALPLGRLDNLPVADEKNAYTRSVMGRRILLHANAIRQYAMGFSFANMTNPQFFAPSFLHRAGLTMLAYIQGNASKPITANTRTYELSHEVDWEPLGELGCSNKDRLSTFIETGSEPSSLSRVNTRSFINHGAAITLNGQPFRAQDVGCFVGWLRAFGQTFGLANVMADDIQERMG